MSFPKYIWHTQTVNDGIDEVESLTAARAGAMAGTEPSDGLRVCHRTLQPFFFSPTILQGRKCPLNTIGQAQAAEKCFDYGHQQPRKSDRSEMNLHL